ncbi:uncharacterized protein C8A04DRAFT_37432 [Dichotomopilus funicola]|uniref:Galactose oxidase n=1 Tax=Dichotomopilus funicola TaxID=1934379 RepID=A0AAN6ZNC0_9PEZI|nr:hypothetical protein C8A04DRAFT_37432 [Dichotomopilus funicola]
MAEVAAAAIAAEQAVATGVEAAAAVAIAAPTLPLKISLTHLPNPAPEGSPHPALARSHHTLTVLNNKAYIFGGQDPSGALCPPGIHTLTLPPSKTTIDPTTASEGTTNIRDSNTLNNTANTASTYTTTYTCYPPYSLQDASTGETLVPLPRADHAACARGRRYLLIHGGRTTTSDGYNKPVDEGNDIWQWDSQELTWSRLRGDSQLGKTMRPRWRHWMVGDGEQGFLVVVGGKGGGGGGEGEGLEREVWMYDFESMVWTDLPAVPGRPLAVAYADGRVYAIASGEKGVGKGGRTELGGVVYYLDMKESATEREKPGSLLWETVTYPANPLAPGPQPRAGGALVPLSTGHGREYLVYLFGRSEGSPAVGAGEKYYSDIWTLQLPAHRRSAAAVKDTIREKLPRVESNEFRWAEAEIVPTEQLAEGGKVHPGPIAVFAVDSCLDGRGVVLWGGTNAKGEKQADGWVLRLAHGYADRDRYE